MIRRFTRRYNVKPNGWSLCPVVHFLISSSVRELADAAATGTKSHPRPFIHHLRDRSFFGREFDEWDDVCTASTEVWQHGMDTISRMLSELEHIDLPQVTSRKRKLKWKDDYGDELCRDRELSGQAAWRRKERQHVKTKRGSITIVSELTAHGGVSPTDVLWRGAAALMLTHILENAGYRVELWGVRCTSHCFTRPDSDGFFAACVKSLEQPCNLPVMVSALSAWYYRTVGFHAVNVFQDLRPYSDAGREREGGVEPLLHELTSDPHVVVIRSVWSREKAIQCVSETAQAVNDGDIASCPWTVSPCRTGGE